MTDTAYCDACDRVKGSCACPKPCKTCGAGSGIEPDKGEAPPIDLVKALGAIDLAIAAAGPAIAPLGAAIMGSELIKSQVNVKQHVRHTQHGDVQVRAHNTTVNKKALVDALAQHVGGHHNLPDHDGLHAAIDRALDQHHETGGRVKHIRHEGGEWRTSNTKPAATPGQPMLHVGGGKVKISVGGEIKGHEPITQGEAPAPTGPVKLDLNGPAISTDELIERINKKPDAAPANLSPTGGSMGAISDASKMAIDDQHAAAKQQHEDAAKRIATGKYTKADLAAVWHGQGNLHRADARKLAVILRGSADDVLMAVSFGKDDLGRDRYTVEAIARAVTGKGPSDATPKVAPVVSPAPPAIAPDAPVAESDESMRARIGPRYDFTKTNWNKFNKLTREHDANQEKVESLPGSMVISSLKLLVASLENSAVNPHWDVVAREAAKGALSSARRALARKEADAPAPVAPPPPAIASEPVDTLNLDEAGATTLAAQRAQETGKEHRVYKHPRSGGIRVYEAGGSAEAAAKRGLWQLHSSSNTPPVKLTNGEIYKLGMDASIAAHAKGVDLNQFLTTAQIEAAAAAGKGTDEIIAIAHAQGEKDKAPAAKVADPAPAGTPPGWTTHDGGGLRKKAGGKTLRVEPTSTGKFLAWTETPQGMTITSPTAFTSSAAAVSALEGADAELSAGREPKPITPDTGLPENTPEAIAQYVEKLAAGLPMGNQQVLQAMFDSFKQQALSGSSPASKAVGMGMLAKISALLHPEATPSGKIAAASDRKVAAKQAYDDAYAAKQDHDKAQPSQHGDNGRPRGESYAEFRARYDAHNEAGKPLRAAHVEAVKAYQQADKAHEKVIWDDIKVASPAEIAAKGHGPVVADPAKLAGYIGTKAAQASLLGDHLNRGFKLRHHGTSHYDLGYALVHSDGTVYAKGGTKAIAQYLADSQPGVQEALDAHHGKIAADSAGATAAYNASRQAKAAEADPKRDLRADAAALGTDLTTMLAAESRLKYHGGDHDKAIAMVDKIAKDAGYGNRHEMQLQTQIGAVLRKMKAVSTMAKSFTEPAQAVAAAQRLAEQGGEPMGVFRKSLTEWLVAPEQSPEATMLRLQDVELVARCRRGARPPVIK